MKRFLKNAKADPITAILIVISFYMLLMAILFAGLGVVKALM